MPPPPLPSAAAALTSHSGWTCRPAAGKDGGKAKPLKAPKKATKDYDETDVEFLKKKKVGGDPLQQHRQPPPPPAGRRRPRRRRPSRGPSAA